MKFPSYKKQKPDGSYDAIIIGSGMGALTTASFLAKEGKKVLILERHYTAGGFTHMFKRKDYEWDVGIHYIGEVTNPKTALARMFHYMSDGNLKWEPMGDVYDKIIIEDDVYEFRAGVENWKAGIKEHFPDPKDQKAVDEYLNLVYEATGAARAFFAERALPKAISFVAGPFMRGKMLKYAKRTTKEVLDELTDNEKLKSVLVGQFGDYGLPPSQSSFAIHAMVVKHYLKGGAYPIGGSTKIIETIAPGIQAAGGEIYTNAEVKEIIVQNGKAVGVRMFDDQEYLAPIIVSNAGIDITYGQLLNSEEQKKHGLDGQLQEVQHSVGHVSLYLGFKETAEQLNLKKPNLWIYPGYDHDTNVKRYLEDENAPLPVAYVSFPGAKDPDFTNRFPGRTTVEIIGLAPYERFKKWEDERWKHRGEEYEAYKEQLGDRLLEQLYRFEPHLKDKLDYRELSSPLSTKHFVGYRHGEIYGIDHTPRRFQLKFLRPQTPIKNLFLTGQDVVTAGVGGALFGGVLTASAILKRDVMKQVFKQPVAATV